MHKDWELISERKIYDGYRKIIGRTFLLPDGTRREFEIKTGSQIVCILPLTKNSNVILARQFRPGTRKIYNELPGGAMEEGEKHIEGARRELLEETGYQGKLEFVGTTPESAYSTVERHYFVARDCIKVQEIEPDETEFIDVIEMPLSEFRKEMRKGQMTDVQGAYMCLDYLGKL